MKKPRLIIMNLVLIMVFGFIASAHAALVDNGDGTITDTALNLMWLQDANYAYTSGYDSDGMMNWGEAMEWADDLVYAGYDNWVLPETDVSCTGLNCTDSDMGHLYYEELGNPANGPLSSTGPFVNLMPDAYWAEPEIDATYAWDFRFHRGLQVNYVFKTSEQYAIAVREIVTAPEPVSSILFIVGSILFGGRMYSRNKKA